MSLRWTRRVLGIGALLVCAAVASCGTPPDYTPKELEAAKAELRDHIRLRTFAEGIDLGRRWIDRAPRDAELRALYARQLAGWDLSREIREQADAIATEDPQDPWALHLQALVLIAERDVQLAAGPSLEAWEALKRPEFVATYLHATLGGGVEEALAFLTTLDSATRTSPEVMRREAELESWAQYELDDPTWADSSLATYAELRERWPDHVDGYLGAAEHLFRANRPEEALTLLEQAVNLSPGSVDVRRLHWRILFRSDVLAPDERRAAVEASMTDFREAAPESIRGHSVMAMMYRDLGDDERAEQLESLIVERAPLSLRATLIYGREYGAETNELNRLDQEKGRDSLEYRAQLEVVREALDRYLERPLYRDSFRANAYMWLFEVLISLEPVPAERLAEAVRGLAEYDRLNPHVTYGAAPVAMADHTPYAGEAAQIAQSGLPEVVESVESNRSLFKTEGEFEEQLRYQLSLVYDAMGWGYFKSGRIEDGYHALERALALEARNRETRYHLGQVYEHFADEADESGDAEAAVEWLDRAEDSYIAGLGSTRVGENPSQAAIEALYKRRNGGREGIDDYLATLNERDQIRRRERILESRVEAAGSYEPFRLPLLDGPLVDSSDLEGKIAVLHFWGTWCGPCVVEMPQYQSFHARYRDDPDVSVMSISNDTSRDLVEEYLERNGFDFRVLMDDGYVQRAGIGAWPTTWFVDRNGYIQFVKIGNTSKLDEEFTWRVEALRETGGTR